MLSALTQLEFFLAHTVRQGHIGITARKSLVYGILFMVQRRCRYYY